MNFLSPEEKKIIRSKPSETLTTFHQALKRRVMRRVRSGSLLQPGDATQWYYPAAEYLSDAAMLYQLSSTASLGNWIRSVSLGIVRKPAYDWVGPEFRDHREPLTGHLETAHLCWGIAAVIDLAPHAFSEKERAELKGALKEKGIALCDRWLSQNNHLANWRGIMASGALVASAVLKEEKLVDRYTAELAVLGEAFQPDGSYGESLQYGNYLANAMMVAYESLARAYPEKASQLPIGAYAKGMAWMAQSMLYQKPMGGAWGAEPRARAINFNDAAALFRPSGDLLLHVSVRQREHDKTSAGLARWMFRSYYENVPDQGPHDLATFGMRNDWGFLTLPLLAHRQPVSLTPAKANLPLTVACSNGNTMVRDAWNGKTVHGIQAGNNDGCFATGHLQGDLNSFMLAHARERLLVDAGHSCYRNIIHGVESASQTHNTCTFLLEQDQLALQENLSKAKMLEQNNVLPRRTINDGTLSPPVGRGGRTLHCERVGDVSLVVAECAESYGSPVHQFLRCWLIAGAHLTFVWDAIVSDRPLKATWNWVFNNRDGASAFSTAPGFITMHRHGVGLRLFHLAGKAVLQGPVYAHQHDAYHPEPNQLGEGGSGSAWIYRFVDQQPAKRINRLHVIIADKRRPLEQWDLAETAHAIAIEKDGRRCSLSWSGDDYRQLKLEWEGSLYQVTREGDRFSLERKEQRKRKYDERRIHEA